MRYRVYLVAVVEPIPESARPTTVETTGETVPESRPAMERPGIVSTRPSARKRGKKVA